MSILFLSCGDKINNIKDHLGYCILLEWDIIKIPKIPNQHENLTNGKNRHHRSLLPTSWG